MNFCVNCKHYKNVWATSYCYRTEDVEIDLVKGVKRTTGGILICKAERYGGECGKEGIFFESNIPDKPLGTPPSPSPARGIISRG